MAPFSRSYTTSYLSVVISMRLYWNIFRTFDEEFRGWKWWLTPNLVSFEAPQRGLPWDLGMTVSLRKLRVHGLPTGENCDPVSFCVVRADRSTDGATYA